MNNLPFPEKILRLESLVMVCGGCGMWIERYPEYLEGDDGFWQCDKCGHSDTVTRQGRPYGPKSKEWIRLIEQLHELWQFVSPYEFHGIITEPPLPNPWNDTEADMVIVFEEIS